MPTTALTQKDRIRFQAVSIQQAPLTDFLERLFSLLDRRQVRYCVLHSHEDLPQTVSGDLDLAIHPEDWPLLPHIVGDLKAEGYRPLQYFEYAVHGHYLVFGRPEGPNHFLVAVDFIREHRRSGVILASGETLVKGRRRLGRLWIPEPAVEFSYLLAKKVLKGSIGPSQTLRLRTLCRQIGRKRSEKEAASLFGKRAAAKVIEACLDGRLAEQIPALRRRLLLNTLLKKPGKLLAYWPPELARIVRRWCRPTGLFLAVLGPDGAGKSTLIEALSAQAAGVFRRRRIIHWRPMLFGRRRPAGPVTDPHGQPPRSAPASMLRLLWWCLDFCLGYWLIIRPWVARSGLAAFDRYYYDLIADPRRFRYGGPAWLAKAVERLVPSPDLVLVLDAPASVIHSRKRELPPTELERQRSAYVRLAAQHPSSVILNASREAAEVSAEAASAVFRRLAERFDHDQPWWLNLPDHNHTPPALAGSVSRRETLDLVFRALSDWNRTGPPELSNDTERSGSVDLRRPFIALPSRRNPRWLLPLDPKRSAAAGLRLYSAYSYRARLAKGLLSLSVKAGLANRMGEKLTLPEGVLQSLETLVAESVGVSGAVLALSIGTPGRYPKLTAQVMTPQSEVLGYLKIALTGEAATRLSGEARTLRQLGEFDALVGRIPQILYAGDWNGRYTLLQSPLQGRRGPVSLQAAHYDFLRQLAAAYRAPKLGAHVTEAVAACMTRLVREADAHWLFSAEKALAWAGEQLAARVILCGITHGDFAPWNTRIARGGLRVFDWEAAAWGVPVCWDRFHFQVQVQCLLGKSGSLAQARLADVDKALLMLYLIRSLCEGHSEGMDTGGICFRHDLLIELSGSTYRNKELYS